MYISAWGTVRRLFSATSKGTLYELLGLPLELALDRLKGVTVELRRQDVGLPIRHRLSQVERVIDAYRTTISHGGVARQVVVLVLAREVCAHSRCEESEHDEKEAGGTS